MAPEWVLYYYLNTIVVIVPYDTYLDKDGWNVLKTFLKIMSCSLFGQTISSQKRLNEVLKGLITTEDLLSSIKEPQRLLFDTD